MGKRLRRKRQAMELTMRWEMGKLNISPAVFVVGRKENLIQPCSLTHLERLTKPGLDELPANQGTANVKESQMYVSPSLIANLQPPVSVQPRMGSLNDPTVAPQPLRTFYPPPCYSRLNPPLPQCLSLRRCIISLIGMQLLRPLAASASGTTDRFNGINGLFHHLAVVDIGRRESNG